LAGSGEIANLHVPHQMVAASSESTVGDLQTHSLNKLELVHDDDFQDKSGPSIKTLRSWNADTELTLEDASLVVIDDMVESHHKMGDGSSHNESDRATSEPGECEHEKEGENDSIAYTSMEKEFRKLIQENKDLLNTKNALNVVKDDLIAEVDRLTNEVSMYEQAVEQLNSTKDQMKQKVSTLDAELRKTKEELEKAKQKIREVSRSVIRLLTDLFRSVYVYSVLINELIDQGNHFKLSNTLSYIYRTTKRECPIRTGNDLVGLRWPKFSWNETIIRKDLWNYKMQLDTRNLFERPGSKRKNDLVYGNC
jgi:uncharacterized protein YukE